MNLTEVVQFKWKHLTQGKFKKKPSFCNNNLQGLLQLVQHQVENNQLVQHQVENNQLVDF